MEDLREQIEALQKQVKVLENKRELERKERVATVKKEWRFTFTKVADDSMGFDRINPRSEVSKYRLQGTIVNKNECLDAGHYENDVKGGDMVYLVNEAFDPPRIICSSGGGSCYITDRPFFRNKDQTQEEMETELASTFMMLEESIREKAEDVTKIILGQKYFAWR